MTSSDEAPQVIVSCSPSREKMLSTAEPPRTVSWPRPPSRELGIPLTILRKSSPPLPRSVALNPLGTIPVTLLENSSVSAAGPPMSVSTPSRSSPSPNFPSSGVGVESSDAFRVTPVSRAE